MLRILIALVTFALPAIAYAQGTDFIPLLPSLPGITETAKSNSLAPFLSQIYKICIGLAAVLAVLQIMRAGILYMGGDSITEKKQARELIGTALAGLLLVLSPVIVFSIINPDILNLNIGGDKLKTNVTDGIPDFKRDIDAPTDNGNASLGGNADAPPSVLPSTGEVNSTCSKIRNGQIIPNNDTKAAYCCQNQKSATVQCHVEARSNKDLTQTQYCKCDSI